LRPELMRLAATSRPRAAVAETPAPEPVALRRIY
jgi:hypothetical protein